MKCRHERVGGITTATIKEATDAVPGTTEDHNSCIKTYHNQHRWRRGDRKISNGKGSLDH